MQNSALGDYERKTLFSMHKTACIKSGAARRRLVSEILPPGSTVSYNLLTPAQGVGSSYKMGMIVEVIIT
jgi:hypothetical protein